MLKNKEILFKIPKTVYKWLFFLFLILDAIGLGLSQLLEKIELFDISATYNSILAIIPPIVPFTEKYILVFIGLTIFFLVMWLYRPHLLLLKHVSFSPEIAKVEPDFLKEYYAKIIEINECQEMSQQTNNTINAAVAYQDKIIDKVKLKIKKNNLCYYGIAHTPLVFRLGFKLGDQSNLKFLHKLRSNESLFQEWTSGQTYAAIQSDESNETADSQELIVSISTSLEIKEEDLISLKSYDKHILMFKTNSFSFDNITSYVVAENCRNGIMIKIRECVKKYHIKKIHLVISSSVAFTFFLGQAISAQHDPITVVYHYQNNEYSWGICINEIPENAVVINNV